MSFTGPVEDRLAIRELMDAYGDAVTRVDEVDYAACWADEGAKWSIPWYPDIGTIEGKENIMEVWREAMKTFAGDHFVMHPGSIKIDGNRAKVTAHTSETFDIDGVVHRDRGYYLQECIKVDGKWYFLEQTFWLEHRQTFEKKTEDKKVTDNVKAYI